MCSESTRSRELLQKIYHFDGRQRRVGPLVAGFAAGTVEGELFRLTGQYTEDYRDAGCESGLGKAIGRAAAHVFVMIGVPFDDGAQTDDGDVFLGCRQPLGD